jgi:outer membrane protein assembly factor BamE (lipoprotein component of BamABCDE complex)
MIKVLSENPWITGLATSFFVALFFYIMNKQRINKHRKEQKEMKKEYELKTEEKSNLSAKKDIVVGDKGSEKPNDEQVIERKHSASIGKDSTVSADGDFIIGNKQKDV